MSTTIDSKVVEMRFDNKQFESNVSTSMSTLDKLKQKLNLTGATKGLEDIGTAAKKIDTSGLAQGVETVTAKFSALQVMGVTALANITNSAVNAAKQMVNSLTVAPVTDGFQEYEMTLNAIQTTMAGTGKTAKEVETELKKLDEYADKTVYSTSDMLNNLPKFTNAGVALEDATKAMIGIANATALAGGDAGKASIAFYNLGQAIGTGYLTRMDYNSINNAGIATMEWKEQMVEAAIAAGTLTEAEDGLYEAGGKTFTMQQLFIDGLQHQWATTDVMMKVFGDYGDETTEIGEKAYSAAQDIKTFSMMMDSLKATAGTGWKDTWQTVFGGLDEAKVFWTGLNNFISGIITSMADFRNTLLETALGRGFTELKEKITSITNPVKNAIDTVENSIDGITRTLEEHQAVVKSVIRGEWGNTKVRWNALADAGYDWVYVQNLVNEKLGSSVRRTSAYTEMLEKQSSATGEATTANAKLEQSEAELLSSLCELSDEQLRQAGYTEEQIQALRDLKAMADKLGLSVEDLVNNIDEIDGRWLIIESFKNAWSGLSQVFSVIGAAWTDVFPIKTAEEYGQQLFDVIAAIHKFTTSLTLSEDTAINLFRTFKGLFAAIDIVTTILGGGLKIAFKAVSALLSYFHLDIFEVTAVIGDAIVMVRDWIDSILDFEAIFEIIIPPIQNGIKAFLGWIETLKSSENLPKDIAEAIGTGLSNMVKAVGNFFANIGEHIKTWYNNISADNPIKAWLESLKDTDNLPKAIADSIISGLKTAVTAVGDFFSNIWESLSSGFEGVPDNIISGFVDELWNGIKTVALVVWELGKTILTTICDVLGIHSPSKEFQEIGSNCILGWQGGLAEGASMIWDFVKLIGTKCIEIIKDIDLGTVIAGIISVGIISTVTKLTGILESIVSPLEGLSDMFESIGTGIKNRLNADAVYTVAKAIAVLVAAVVVLALIGPEKVWAAVGVLGAIVGMLTVLTIAMGIAAKISKIDPASFKDIPLITMVLVTITGAVLLVAIALRVLAGIPTESILPAIATFTAIVVGLGILMKVASTSFSMKNQSGIAEMGSMLLKISVAMLLMVAVIKLVSGMETADIIKGIAVIGMFELLCTELIMVSKFAGEHGSKAGGLILKFSLALILLVGVMKLVSWLEPEEIVKGLIFMGFVELFVSELVMVSKYAGEHASKAGVLVLMFSLALLGIVAAMKLVGTMDVDEIKRGIAAIGMFALLCTGLIAVSKLAGENAKQAGTMILTISAALLILVAVIFVISLLDPADVWHGVGVIAALEALFAGLMFMTKYTKATKGTMGTLIALIVAITLMTALIVALAFLDPAKVAVGAAAVAAMAGVFALLMYTSSFLKSGEKTWKRNLATIGILVIAVAAMAGIVIALAQYDPMSVLGSAAALGVLLLTLAGSMKILGSHSGFKKGTLTKVTVSMGILVGVMALIGLVLAMMTKLNVENVIPNAAALSVALIAVAGAAKILGSIGSVQRNVLMGALGLAALVGVMALIGLVLAMMSALKVRDSLEHAVVLSGLLVVLTGVAAALGVIGAASTNILMGALGLAALVGVMALIGLVLAMMSALTINNAVENALILSGLLVVLTGVAAVLAIVGFLAPNILMGALGMAALVGVMALIGLVLAMMSALNIQNGMENANILISLLTTMTDVCVKLALVGPLALIGVGAMVALTALMLGVGALAVAVGALMEKFPAIQQFLDAGIPVLEQLANGVGSIIGNFVSGFMGGIADGLPDIGTKLSEFMTNAMPFIEGAKLVDESVLTGVGILAASVLALTAVDLIEGIVSFISCGESFASLGTELSNFMENATPFIEGAKMMDETAIEGVRSLAEAMLILTGASLIDQLVQFLGLGEGGLSSFGNQLPGLGTNMANFATNLGTFTEENVASVTCAANAIKTLAQAAEALPNDGGLLGALLGENGIGAFGDQLPGLGTNMANFATNLGTFTEENVASVTNAANAIKAIAAAAEEIPNEGGLASWFAGENSIATFVGYLPQVGTNLTDFAANLDGFGSDQLAVITNAADAIKIMIAAAEEIPNEGGLASWFAGENSIKTFAGYLPDVGSNLAGFATNLDGFTEDDLTSVTNAAAAIAAIADVSKSLPSDNWWSKIFGGSTDITTFTAKFPTIGSNLRDFAMNLGSFASNHQKSITCAVGALQAFGDLSDCNLTYFTKNIEGFGNKLAGLGTDIAGFVTKIKDVGVDNITAATDAAKMLAENISDISTKNADSLNNFGDSLKSLADTGISSFVSEFTSSTVKTDLMNAAIALVEKVIEGFESKHESVETAGTTIASKGSAAIKSISNWLLFHDAGSYLVAGFVKGIDDTMWQATAKARAMARAAASAAEEELDINSPSKVFRAIGTSIPEGFAMGIDKLRGMVTGSSADMATSAVDGTKSAIARLADVVNSDIDSQPTIRPVLDLSDVQTGAGAIAGMLGLGSSIGVRSSVGTISHMMNLNSQNGANDDVVSAIDRMNKKLDSISTPSYTINGITYDDGSNITEAVRTLVRAATMERRV